MTPIYDLTPFSTIDYAGKLSSIVWFAGCNLRCLYCYNPHIVFGKGRFSTEEVLGFFKKRVGLIDAVVLSGGEPTMFHALEEFCHQIKDMGFLLKLDTNGANYGIVESLLQKELIDFVSLDLKATKDKYQSITGKDIFSDVLITLRAIIDSGVDYEVRTTLHSDLLDAADIESMSKVIRGFGYKNSYFIQKYRDAKSIKKLKNRPIDERKYNISGIVWR